MDLCVRTFGLLSDFDEVFKFFFIYVAIVSALISQSKIHAQKKTQIYTIVVVHRILSYALKFQQRFCFSVQMNAILTFA